MPPIDPSTLADELELLYGDGSDDGEDFIDGATRIVEVTDTHPGMHYT